jgi:hypothetical protein
MEDWIDAIKDKVLAEQPELPPGDWERFEADYLAPKRKRRVLPFILALTSAAAAVLAAVLLVNRPSTPDPVSVEHTYVAEVTPVDVPEAVEAAVAEMSIPPARTPGRVFVPMQVPDVHEVEETASTLTETVDEVVVPVSESEAPSRESESEVVPESVTEPVQIERWPDVFEDVEEQNAPKRVAFAPLVKGFQGRGNGQSNPVIVGTPDYSHTPIGAPPGFVYGVPYKVRPESFTSQHMIPLSFGLDVSVALLPRLALTSGIDLSLYRSVFTVTETTGGMQFHQRAYYLGIPLRLDWTLWDQGRFSAWLGAGGKADYLISGKFDELRLKDNTIHFSAVGDLGVQYRLLPNIGLFLQPEVSYYFKPADPVLETYRTEHPLTFSLGVGARFSF